MSEMRLCCQHSWDSFLGPASGAPPSSCPRLRASWHHRSWLRPRPAPGHRTRVRERCDIRVSISAWKSSIRRFVMTEKAPTKAFSWLKAATTSFTFKTLLRHYAKRTLTPRSLNVKLGPRRNYHEGRAAIRHYANQTARPLWPLRREPNVLIVS